MLPRLTPAEYFNELRQDRQRQVLFNIFGRFRRLGNHEMADWCTEECLFRIISAKQPLNNGPLQALKRISPRWYDRQAEQALLAFSTGLKKPVVAAYRKHLLTGRGAVDSTEIENVEDRQSNVEEQLLAESTTSDRVGFLGELRARLNRDKDAIDVFDVLDSESEVFDMSAVFDGEQRISIVNLLVLLTKNDPSWTYDRVENALRRLRGHGRRLRLEYAARGVAILDKPNSDEAA